MVDSAAWEYLRSSDPRGDAVTPGEPHPIQIAGSGVYVLGRVPGLSV